MAAYYNENDRFAAAWLRELIKEGLIADGEVDERDIRDVQAEDVRGFTQCHWFAGIGGWSAALRLAGWSDSRECWTGSCPCQPFSQAASINGRKGFADPRHLWPEWKRLISERRPPTVFGEQSAAASDWLRLVRSDLVSMDYAVGCVPIEAASVGADHERDRFWFVADADFDSESVLAIHAEMEATPLFVANVDGPRLSRRREAGANRQDARDESTRHRSGDDLAGNLRGHWAHQPVLGGDVHGIPHRVGQVRGFGNAIVPQVAAAFVSAYMNLVDS